MKLYNTFSQALEPFKPKGDDVTVYVCGITPYDTTHLGHAFTYTVADVIIRYLEFQGHTVRYVQNVTDIDDDILRKAKEVDENWRSLVNHWTAHFIGDMQSLNVRPPDHFPRATDIIPDIIKTVQKLLDVGVAYERAGNVYFNVESWSDYGKLSCLSADEMLSTANERGNNPDDPNKRDPLDFVLWQAHTPGEPAWESPWGPGRPGWHIECSTMATKFLGETIDIHSGGGDLVFPHHESEIAQLEPITGGKPFVRFWVHAAMVGHFGEKMSKSLGNLVMARDLLQTYSPDAIRIYLAIHHYRKPWNHDEGELVKTAELAERLQNAMMRSGDDGPPLDPIPLQNAFIRAMDDDLDTAPALSILNELGEKIFTAARSGQSVATAQNTLRTLSQIFGLCLDAGQPEQKVIDGWGEHLKRFAEPTVA